MPQLWAIRDLPVLDIFIANATCAGAQTTRRISSVRRVEHLLPTYAIALWRCGQFRGFASAFCPTLRRQKLRRYIPLQRGASVCSICNRSSTRARV